MAKIISPLTSTEVKHAKPKIKEYNLADGNGLMLRIKPSGSKIWLFNYYQPFTKKRVNLGFGQYPNVTLAKAREKRAEARALLADDIDPKDHKNQHAEVLHLTGEYYQHWLIHTEQGEVKGKKQTYYCLDERHFSCDWEQDKDRSDYGTKNAVKRHKQAKQQHYHYALR